MAIAVTSRPSDWRVRLARAGLATKGVLYLVVGVLALQFALGHTSGDAASHQGAIRAVAAAPAGTLLLVLLAFGLAAHGVWQLVAAASGDPLEGDTPRARLKFLARAIVSIGLAGLTARPLLGGPVVSEEGTDQAASTILDLPGGVWIAVAIGLGVVALGIRDLVHHGMHTGFMERVGGTGSGGVRRAVERIGRAGHVGRGVVWLLVGAFFVGSAVSHDPSRSRGMSESLQAVATQPWGPAVTLVVAAGMVLYGIFSVAEARYRRVA